MNNNIVDAYEILQSIKGVAQQKKISEGKVIKTLITEGAFTNSTSIAVHKLHAKGKTEKEISAELGLSISCVNMYLPYRKGAYRSDCPTQNAIRIRECRERKGGHRKPLEP